MADPALTARRVTRDVEPSAMGRLLEDPPRATVAFVEREAVEVLPAKAWCRGGMHLFAVRSDGATDLDGRDVVLLIDGGAYWFELCGISVRGVAKRANSAAVEGADPLRWYAVVPRRVLAWDYDAVREE